MPKCQHCGRKPWRPDEVCCNESLYVRKYHLRRRLNTRNEHLTNPYKALLDLKQMLEA